MTTPPEPGPMIATVEMPVKCRDCHGEGWLPWFAQFRMLCRICHYGRGVIFKPTASRLYVIHL